MTSIDTSEISNVETCTTGLMFQREYIPSDKNAVDEILSIP